MPSTITTESTRTLTNEKGHLFKIKRIKRFYTATLSSNTTQYTQFNTVDAHGAHATFLGETTPTTVTLSIVTARSTVSIIGTTNERALETSTGGAGGTVTISTAVNWKTFSGLDRVSWLKLVSGAAATSSIAVDLELF